MKKENQDLFYGAVGRELTRCREQKKLSISQLATKSGEQFNTIKAIEDGRPFMAHQLYWMKEVVGMNLNILITDAYNTNKISMKEEDNGQEESTTQSAPSLNDFL